VTRREERSDTGAPSVFRLSRRHLLRDSALAASAAAGLAVPADALAGGPARGGVVARLHFVASSTQEVLESYAPVALTSAELATLKAAIDRLIPNDDLGPGAVEAGAFVSIDRALAGDDAASLPLVQGGLAALEQAAGSGGFAALAPDQQDDLLRRAETDQLAGASAGFFPMLLELTRRGMFGDPIHGGNRDFVGWDLIGYPGIKLVWSAEEQAIDAVVEPAHTSVAQFGRTAS
jgi:hypothetical protein